MENYNWFIANDYFWPPTNKNNGINQWFSTVSVETRDNIPKAKLPEKRLKTFPAFFRDFENSVMINGQIVCGSKHNLRGKCVDFDRKLSSFLYKTTSDGVEKFEKYTQAL